VLYEPDIKFVEANIKKCKNQVSTIIIIDNSKISNEHLLNTDSIIYIHNEYNVGLGRALNQGFSLLNENLEWCLTLDQDSELSDNFLVNFTEIYDIYLYKNKIASISSNYVTRKLKKPAFLINEKFIEINYSITSGTLYNISYVKSLGLFKERYFIEGIDIEFSIKVKIKGLKQLLMKNIIMIHSAGDTTERIVFDRIIITSNHSPFRLYLQARNNCRTLVKYNIKTGDFIIVLLKAYIKKIILIIFLEKNKFSKLSSIIKGFIVGLFYFKL